MLKSMVKSMVNPKFPWWNPLKSPQKRSPSTVAMAISAPQSSHGRRVWSARRSHRQVPAWHRPPSRWRPLPGAACEGYWETTNPIGSMYGIYANIWGILMVNVTIYSIYIYMDPMGMEEKMEIQSGDIMEYSWDMLVEYGLIWFYMVVYIMGFDEI